MQQTTLSLHSPVIAERKGRADRGKGIEPKQGLEIKTNQSGPTLLPFQVAAAQLMVEDAFHGGSLNADEMGLGKTAVTIAAINTLNPPEPVLIVSPASLVENWKREWTTWALPELPLPLFINYEKLRKLVQTYFPVIVFDESHYIKNNEAQRTQIALSLEARVRYFLTGTPILNRPVEIFTAINAIRPGAFGSFIDFTKRYCKGRWWNGEWIAEGATNLDELQDKLYATCLIRRTKAKCLTNLPPKTQETIRITPNDETRQKISEYKETADRYKRDLNDLYRQIAKCKMIVHKRPLLSDANRLQNEANRNLHPARILAAEAKLPRVIALVEQLRKKGEPVVVYCIHQQIYRTLYAHFKGRKFRVASISQQTNPKQRQEAVDRFQTGGAFIFLATIGTASSGVTLTAARHLILAELDWSPGNMQQTEDRIWRIGQTKPVTIHRFILEDSLDEGMLDLLERKETVIEEAL